MLVSEVCVFGESVMLDLFYGMLRWFLIVSLCGVSSHSTVIPNIQFSYYLYSSLNLVVISDR